ncbi:hypothetical protein Glove_152g80 [Diversispora epigaea]|uniref:Uncharacterized protein n=1 Tax=Diversispora epigaea TaxID=1348612 RepID=A0A397IX72_9GLOM|nr:hypothetical protein Glove_152g80 [Diversispora epigaea]
MALIRPENFDIIFQVLTRIIQGANASLNIKITNKHSILRLSDPQLLSKGIRIPLDSVDPLAEHTAQVSDKFISKGMLSYKVEDENRDFHYLVITWKVKTKMMMLGRNSVTVNILRDPPKNSSYNELHVKENKKYPGENINPENFYYRISGGIGDGYVRLIFTLLKISAF